MRMRSDSLVARHHSMKHFLASSFFILTLLVGGVPAVHAQITERPVDTTVNTDSIKSQVPTLPPASADTANKPANQAANDIPTPTRSPDTSTYGGVMTTIMGLFAWLLGVAALALDAAVYYTVVTMGDYINKLSAVGVAWRILRDIGNIALIFGFLAIGITTILNVDWYGGGTKMLPKLLIAAVFLNFSLFISEAVIDTGNLFATQFYTQIKGGELPSSGTPNGGFWDAVENEGISNKIMGQLGLQTIYDVREGNSALLKDNNEFFVGFLGILLFLIAAFVMFSLAFVLIARFVILIFLIILAPIGFAGMAIPQLQGIAQKWWNELFNQTLVAPVLLLLLYVALAVITDTQFLTGFDSGSGASWTSIAKGDISGFIPLLLSFLVAMGLLLAVTMVAKNMSAFGAGAAMKLGGAASFGLAAYAATAPWNAAGRLGRFGVQNTRLGNTGAGRFLVRNAFRPMENSRLDARRLPGVGAGLGAMGAGAASAPMQKSALARAQQPIEYLKKRGKEEAKQYDSETKIPRLVTAINTANRADASKIMRSLTDDEFGKGAVQDLIARNPLAVETMTNAQASKLSDKALLTPNVYQNLSLAQLEAIRHAGNVAPIDPAGLMAHWLENNQYSTLLAVGVPAHVTTPVRRFWNIP